MLKLTVCLLLTLNASIAGAAVTTEYLQGLGDTRYHHLKSEAVGRAYHIYVMLPDDYDETGKTKYPTVYLLDGGALFPLVSAYYRYLKFGEEVPSAIIVGISYGAVSFEDGNNRSTDYTAKSVERDYWGGAETFQEFLSKELLPLIENKYSSNRDRRVIFGQSIGGQFVLYTALTKPDLFYGHIASNPALHRNLPFFLTRPVEHKVTGNTSKLFVASAENDDPRYKVPAMKWIERWSDIEDKPWRLKITTLDGHSHMSAPPAAFRQGMQWLFAAD